MNKSEQGKRIHTAPVRVDNSAKLETGARLRRELGVYARRIEKAHRGIKHSRRVGHDKVEEAQARGESGIKEIAASAITDIFTDTDLGKISHASYLVKKLTACLSVIDETRDGELAYLRLLMKGQPFKP
jgi:hypothetical protein